jgi:hypothetical protein
MLTSVTIHWRAVAVAQEVAEVAEVQVAVAAWAA